MIEEEHETILNFDYAEKRLHVWTTRESVFNGIKKRLGEAALKECQMTVNRRSWVMEIPMKFARSPQSIMKLVNPDQKTSGWPKAL